MATLSVELPVLLANRLQAEARRRRMAPDELVQEALEHSLPPSATDFAPRSLAIAAHEFIGRFEGPSDLATNPRYLDDLGQ